MYVIPTWRWSVFYKSIVGSVLIACSFWVTTKVTLAAPITPGSFSTTWKTDNSGTSGTNQITIPTTGGGYNYDVYWEEVGNDTNNGSSTGNTGNLTITFPSIGTYRVDITGTFPQIYVNNSGDRNKLLTVEQWGAIPWTSFNAAFYGALNLTLPATDAPDLSLVTNMQNSFRSTNINQPINHWNVSNVTNMQEMFYDTRTFNQPLNNWDVSSVIDMSWMFSGADNFNQPLNNWNVANVTNMRRMFNGADNFNQPLNNWNVANVTDMALLFAVSSFNQPLNNWDVSNITEMDGMFFDTPFNQSLNNWNVSSVINMASMFQGATAFNQSLSGWNVSAVSSMRNMFNGATAFNQPLNNWNVSNVVDMVSMFNSATAFNQPLNNWNVGQVAVMDTMFNGSNLSVSSYSSTLIGWGSLSSVQSNVSLGSSAQYCSTASSSRNNLVTNYTWTITDGGVGACYTLSYAAGLNATLIGSGTQIVTGSGSGTSVEVVPDSGYQFVSWSDGVTSNPRTDSNPTADINVTAVVAVISSGGGGGSSKRNQNNVSDTATGTTVFEIASTTENSESSTFMDSVTNLLGFLQINQDTVKSMPEEEKKKTILLLQAIIAYLMSLLVELKA